jgi:hypothetical protein
MGELFASVRQEGCCQESIGRNMHGSSHVCPAQRKMAAKLRKLLSKLIRFQNRGVREYPNRATDDQGLDHRGNAALCGCARPARRCQGSVVELARPVRPLDGFGGRANVGPVAGKFFVGEVAGIGHMPGTAEGHDSHGHTATVESWTCRLQLAEGCRLWSPWAARGGCCRVTVVGA